jgi:hypothetical protein
VQKVQNIKSIEKIKFFSYYKIYKIVCNIGNLGGLTIYIKLSLILLGCKMGAKLQKFYMSLKYRIYGLFERF